MQRLARNRGWLVRILAQTRNSSSTSTTMNRARASLSIFNGACMATPVATRSTPARSDAVPKRGNESSAVRCYYVQAQNQLVEVGPKYKRREGKKVNKVGLHSRARPVLHLVILWAASQLVLGCKLRNAPQGPSPKDDSIGARASHENAGSMKQSPVAEQAWEALLKLGTTPLSSLRDCTSHQDDKRDLFAYLSLLLGGGVGSKNGSNGAMPPPDPQYRIKVDCNHSQLNGNHTCSIAANDLQNSGDGFFGLQFDFDGQAGAIVLNSLRCEG